MRTIGFSCALVASALSVVTPAKAVLLKAVFSGTIGTVHYADATFGTNPLSGQTYTATYLFDPSVGTTYPPYVGCAGCFDQITDGLSPNITIQSVAITINGLTDLINFAAPAYAQSRIEHVNYNTSSQVYLGGTAGQYVPARAGPPAESYSYFQGGSSYAAAGPKSIDWAVPWSPAGGSGSSGFTKQVQNAGRGYDQAYSFNGTVTSASISAAVPEPASWAMMIGGFALVGMSARRRSKLNFAPATRPAP